MKRALILVGLIGLTSWVSSGPAAAGPRPPSCVSVNGTSCSPLGSTTPCTLALGGTANCVCFNSGGGHLIYSCPIPAPPG